MTAVVASWLWQNCGRKYSETRATRPLLWHSDFTKFNFGTPLGRLRHCSSPLVGQGGDIDIVVHIVCLYSRICVCHSLDYRILLLLLLLPRLHFTLPIGLVQSHKQRDRKYPCCIIFYDSIIINDDVG